MKTGRKRKLSVEKTSSVKTGVEPKKRQQIAKEATSTATVQDASTSKMALPLTKGRSASSVKTGTELKKRQQVAKKVATTATVQDASTRRKVLPLTKGRSASSVVTAKDPTTQKKERKTSKKDTPSATVQANSREVLPPSRSTVATSLMIGGDQNTQKKERKTTKKDTPSVIVQDASSLAEALPNRDTPIAFKCSICLDTTCHKKMKRLLCSHEFHEVCVDEWLRRNTSCPYCRKALAPPRPPPRGVNQENEAQRFERLQVEILLLGNGGRNFI